MNLNQSRIKYAARAMGAHFGISLVVALLIGFLVLVVWYPYPYREMAAGRELFILVMVVDLVCGPLLTFILYTPTKPRRELITDLSMVAALQLAALAYGMWTVWLVKPLYLVFEFDRFKVITISDIDAQSMSKLPAELKPPILGGPLIVGLRKPTAQEREKVMFESVEGGKDYGERPEFYKKYSGEDAYQKAYPLSKFTNKYPAMAAQLDATVSRYSGDPTQLRYLPIIARKDWIAIMDSKGELISHLPGDGF